jgi:mannose-6-phosphate isomerase-like protein (cupin superfamily)
MGREKKRKHESPFPFEKDIKRLTTDNLFYRRVLYTGPHSQLVLMSIPPEAETGEERQDDADKMLFIVKGKAESSLNHRARETGKYDIIFVPAGNLHNLKNVGHHDLRLFAIYSPPLYTDGTVHRTQEEALAARGKQFAYAWEQ